MKITKLLLAALIVVIVIGVIASSCDNEPEIITPTAFEIKAEKVLIADKNGHIQVDLNIEPGNVYPFDINFESSDKKVATATLGAIDSAGNVVTAAEIQEKKDKLAKKDKEEAEKIIVPTDTAIISANGYGECSITGTLGKLNDNIKVIVADKQIALTFDDGACQFTPKLLKGLRKEDVKVTFFVVGQMTKRSDVHMDALKQAIADGHEIGNHTYNHKAGADTLKKELKKTDKLIEKLGGEKTTLMRPPGGVINNGTRHCGKSIIMWSVDTLDWKYRDPDKVCKNILKSKDGDIILLHDLHKTTVKGALKAIPKLKKKGFYPVTVTELIGEPKPNKEYKKVKKGKLKTQILER